MDEAIKVGDWLVIESGQMLGFVFALHENGVDIGYRQHTGKLIGETVVLRNARWEFEHPGPDGSYLRGPDAARVKAGPQPYDRVWDGNILRK